MARFTVACQNDVGKRSVSVGDMGDVGSFAVGLFKGSSRWQRDQDSDQPASKRRQPWHRSKDSEVVLTQTCRLWEERHCTAASDDTDDMQLELGGQVGKTIAQHCDALVARALGVNEVHDPATQKQFTHEDTVDAARRLRECMEQMTAGEDVCVVCSRTVAATDNCRMCTISTIPHAELLVMPEDAPGHYQRWEDNNTGARMCSMRIVRDDAPASLSLPPLRLHPAARQPPHTPARAHAFVGGVAVDALL